MMGDLTHGPSAIAVGRLDLLRREPLHRGAQGSRSLFDVVDQFLTLLLVRRTVVRKFSDGITRIAHLVASPPKCSRARAPAPTTINRKRERVRKAMKERIPRKDFQTDDVKNCIGQLRNQKLETGNWKLKFLMYQRENSNRSGRSSRYFRRRNHGDGAVGGHAVEVGHVGQKIEPMLRGILSDGRFSG